MIGALVVLLVITMGAGATALVVVGGGVGYFVGKFLDGELDLEEVRARAQGRDQGRDTRAQEDGPYAPPAPVASGAGSPSRSTPLSVR
ncbi:MAG TPA: hypothetical protein VFY59_05865 [Rubrobacter sp.]|nr:hypothetical protein [Rubrobacter sp.]